MMRFFRAFTFSSIIFAESMANNFIFLFSDNSKNVVKISFVNLHSVRTQMNRIT